MGTDTEDETALICPLGRTRLLVAGVAGSRVGFSTAGAVGDQHLGAASVPAEAQVPNQQRLTGSSAMPKASEVRSWIALAVRGRVSCARVWTSSTQLF